jgi:hypothetical protein
MVENRNRFLRFRDTLVNLENVKTISFNEKENKIDFYCGSVRISISNADRAWFERIASAIKHGRVEA